MTRMQQAWLWGGNVLVGITGAVLAMVKTFYRSPPPVDEFDLGGLAHPWQAGAQHLHLWLAPILVIAIGMLHAAQSRGLSVPGDVSISGFDDIPVDEKYDLIINGTSAGLHNELPPVPDSVLGINSVCYDMMYNLAQQTVFVKWAIDRGALRAYDGLGMLVEQAAESFYIWRGVRPQTAPVIASLRESL